MHRRDLLRQALWMNVGVLLAGCTDPGETGPRDTVVRDGTPTSDGEGSPSETEKEIEKTTTESGADAASATSTDVDEADIQFEDDEMIVDEGEFTTDVYVAARIVNYGGAPSGQVELTADWYDGDGNYLDNSKQFLESLGPDETWAARIYYLGTNENKVADYEISGQFEDEPPMRNPKGLELLNSELQSSEQDATVTGRVENTRDQTVEYIQATAKLYNNEGVLLGDEYTNVTDVPAGETWRFEVSWLGRDRTDDAVTHGVWLTDTAL